MKDESKPLQPFIQELIRTIKEYIMKLILIIVKQTIALVYPMDYLYLLKIIFKTIIKNPEMFQHCTQECLQKNLKLLEFFNELFQTNIIELKIIATELTLFAPIEIKHFIIKYSKSLVPIMTFAFTLQEPFIILKAIQN